MTMFDELLVIRRDRPDAPPRVLKSASLHAGGASADHVEHMVFPSEPHASGAAAAAAARGGTGGGAAPEQFTVVRTRKDGERCVRVPGARGPCAAWRGWV